MKLTTRYWLSACAVLSLGLGPATDAKAHMLVAQHGTLNFVDGGVFMVLSLPVSAFDGVDDDADGLLSADEFSTHRLSIAEVIKQRVTLRDSEGGCSLDGLLMSPVEDHGKTGQPAEQLIIMGRFALRSELNPLVFSVDLFGDSPEEQLLEVTATRGSDKLTHEMELTPHKISSVLFQENQSAGLMDYGRLAKISSE